VREHQGRTIAMSGDERVSHAVGRDGPL
jgi:hypothetical protein